MLYNRPVLLVDGPAYGKFVTLYVTDSTSLISTGIYTGSEVKLSQGSSVSASDLGANTLVYQK